VAVALDNAAPPGSAAAPYPFEIDAAAGVPALDLRPLWRALAADVAAGVPPGAISARFHAALAAGGADLVRRAADERGRLPVVLTGGCFQNASLAEGIARELGSGFEVYQHGQVPPGDGGIALGQAIVADAVSGGARTS
jgi:hydrogenase maturation protein HypF